MKPSTRKTPTALALVRGNPGKRKIPQHEPKPPISCPAPPAWLGEQAQIEWLRICPRLADLGLMSDIDIAVLAAYCSSFGDLVDATAASVGNPTIVETKNKVWMQSPWVPLIRYARADMVRYAAQLGMTPSARAGMDIRVGNEAPKAAADPAATYFA